MQKRSHTLLARTLMEQTAGFDKRRFALAFLFGSFQPDCNPLSYGRESDVETLSAGLFAALRELDDPAIATVYARCPEGGGVAYAVQNRLKKAAAFRIVNGEEEV